MPYFLFRISPRRRFEQLASFDKYTDARQQARAMRSALRAGEDIHVKVVFAANPEEAERLLAEPRAPRPLGEDA